MTQDNPPAPSPDNSSGNEYDLKPSEKELRPRPGDPDFVPPTPVILPADKPEPEPEPVDPDVANNKAMAILAYIFFVIPLLAAPQSKFARFHANQGLLVFILWCVAVIGSIIIEAIWTLSGAILTLPGVIWFFFGCFVHIVPVALFIIAIIFSIMGIINAANGERTRLPLIGHWTLIK